MNVPIRAEGTANVTLNGSGNGTASVGPLTARETWHPENAHVSVSSANSEASCVIYVGDSALQRNQRDTTFTGSSGDASDKIGADIVKPPHKIWAVWTGGDPGAVATLTVTGSKDI